MTDNIVSRSLGNFFRGSLTDHSSGALIPLPIEEDFEECELTDEQLDWIAGGTGSSDEEVDDGLPWD